MSNRTTAEKRARVRELLEKRTKQERRFPLSFAQERLWFLEQLEPGGTKYNVCGAVELIGPLDPHRLEQSLGAAVARHDILRTAFRTEGGAPVQVVSPHVDLGMQHVDLTHLAPELAATEVRRRRHLERDTPFDLGVAPLLRSVLLRIDAARHILLVSMHHIVSDGWSLALLCDEIAWQYQALQRDRAPAERPGIVQYGAYAAWQRRWLEGDELDRQLTYWLEHLRDAPPRIALPTDRPRVPGSERGALHVTALDAKLSEDVERLARGNGCTLFMTLLAAYAALLARYSQQEDVVVGTPIANRHRSEIEGTLGFFVNTLALRISCAGDPTVRELLARVREVALGAYAHQDLPFEKLVERLNPERDPAVSPIFQVMFILQAGDAALRRFDLGDVEARQLPAEGNTSLFDLTVSAAPYPEGIELELEYSTDLWEPTTIERLAGHLVELLRQMVRAPDARLTSLSCLPERERHQLLVGWNDTARDLERDVSLMARFDEVVAGAPDQVAVRCGDLAWSYANLQRRAARVAEAVQAQGAGIDQIVALFDDRSIDLLAAIMGVHRAGAAYVPLDPHHPPQRIAEILRQSGARCVMTGTSTRALLAAALELLSVEQRPSVIPIAIEEPAVVRLDHRIEPPDDALAYIIFTSGSTGAPKGAMVTWAGMQNHVRALVEELSLTAADVIAQTASQCFDISVWQFITAAGLGGCTHIFPDEITHDPAALLRATEATGVTILQVVPSTLRAMLEEVRKLGEARPRLAALRFLIPTGEALPRDLCAAWFELYPAIPLVNAYGPAECADDVTVAVLRAVPEGALVPVGRPIANLRTYVLDASLEPVPIGVRGELFVGGVGVGRGYLHQPGLTAERFLPDRFSPDAGTRMYRTGDFVRRLADGTLVFLGRVDHQVKMRGFRIELGEIEAALAAHPSVGEAVVIIREDVPGQQQLVGYVVLEERAEYDVEALGEALRARLPAYMVPTAFVLLEALPLTPNGKVDHARLPPPARSGRSAGPPRTATERTLAGVFADLLSSPSIGRADNFFEVGGHSLLAARLVSRIAAVLGCEVPLRAVFDHPTVAGLARVIDERTGLGTPVAHAIAGAARGAQVAPMSFSQQRLWVLEQLDPGATTYTMPGAARLRGQLDPAALEAALRSLGRRHESLRTVFGEDAGQPIQRVLGEVDLALDRASLAALASPAPEMERASERWRAGSDAALAALLDGMVARPFDLERGPLIRALLVELGDQDHVFALTAHHMIADGWSLPLLIDELLSTYQRLRGGDAVDSPPPAVRYVDYAVWQRQWLQGAALDRELAYWTEELAGVPDLLALPTDFPRPEVQSHRGDHVEVPLPAEAVAALRTLAQAAGCTPFMVLVAAMGAVLSRYAGQTDVVIGSPIANRARAATEDVIGLFVNTVALRVRLGGRPTSRELLARVRAMALAAYAHQDLPFERLVDELEPTRSLAHSPIFQVMVSEDVRVGATASALDELAVEPVALATRTAKFDLLVNFAHAPGGIVAELEFASDLFERPTIGRIAGHLFHLLGEMAANVDAEVDQLALEPAPVARALARHGDHECLHTRFERQVAARPDAPALTLGEVTWSYAELNARANRIAHRLIRMGAGPETRVGLFLERSLEMVAGVLGILKAGAAYVPVDPIYPRDRMAFMLADADAGILLTQASLVDRLPPAGDVEVIVVDREDWSGEPAANPRAEANPAQLCYVLYTSGSTGQPKGVAMPHASVSRLFDATDSWYRFGPEDVWPLFHSISFDVSVWEIWGALLHGGRLVVVPFDVSRSPADFLALLVRERATILNQTPSAFRTLLHAELEQPRPSDLALRACVFAGEALELENLRPWFERFGDARPTIVNMYGITETTVHSTYRVIRLADLERGSSVIGVPIPDLDIFLFDRNMQPVPIGVPGEIYVAGAGLARGYHRRPGLTAERFVPHPCSTVPGDRLYRSGDLARRLADGDLEYLGRIDHQVKIRGFRVELGEIEAALLRRPGVKEAVVIARDDDDRRQIVAYVRASKPPPTVESLRDALRAELPEYMVPSGWVFLDALPLTSHGKIDRRALPAPSRGSPRSDVAPSTPREALVARIWCDVLKLPSVGVDDNFFDVGGDSIIALQIVARARAAGLALRPKDIFAHQTVAALARHVSEVAGADLVADTSAGPVALTPIQRWFFGRGLARPAHWNQAIAVEVVHDVDPDRIEVVLRELVARHDALRLGFLRDPATGGWTAHVRDPGGDDLALERRVLGDGEGLPAIELVADALHRQLDLERGPLLRAAYFEGGVLARPVLFVTVHHLAIDGVSWRVLLSQLIEGVASAPPSAGAAGASYARWSRALTTLAGSDSLAEERAYWERQDWSSARRIEPELDLGPNDEASEGVVRVRLDAATTQALLREVPRAYHTQMNDVLLAALVAALTPASDAPVTLAVDLEGHGREPLDGLDTSETVGWFTTIFPVLLERPAAGGWSLALRSIRARLRGVPRMGLGHGVLAHLAVPPLAPSSGAEVLFNYLGQTDAAWDPAAPFALIRNFQGSTRDPAGLRSHLLEVNAEVWDGELHVEWGFSRNKHRRETIAAYAEAQLAALREMVARRDDADAGRRTLADFPLLEGRVTQLELDRLVGDGRDVEDLYPLTGMQQGFLLRSFYAADSVGVEQVHYELEGVLDERRFVDAWRAAVQRHPMLRTSFLVDGLQQPLQRVHREVELAIERLDWRGLDAADRAARLAEHMAADRRRGFDLSVPPLMRVALIRTGDHLHEVVWSHHHVLLDGWSVALVLADVLAAYGAAADRPPLAGASAPAFREHVRWLTARDPGEARAYWRARLCDRSRATPLRIDRLLGEPTDGDVPVEAHARLTAAASEALRAVARRHRVTMSTLVEGLWSVLLASWSGERDVVFGETVSGRADLPDAEAMIGMFINVVPVRVALAEGEAIADWLGRLQRDQLERSAHDHLPLWEIHDASGVPAGRPLFESLVVFENYPFEAAEQIGSRTGLTLRRASGSLRSRYRLTLSAVDEREVSFSLSGDPRLFDATVIDAILAQLVEVSRSCAAGTATIEELLAVAISAAPPAVRSTAAAAGATVELGGHETLVSELERVLGRHPQVADVRVLVDPARVPPRVTAHVAPWDGGRLDGEAVRRWLLDRLPELAPHEICAWTALPRTAEGAVDTAALRERPPGAARRPLTATEETLAEIWCGVLGVAAVEPEDDFFLLGGHSVLSIQLASRITDALGIDLPLRDIFEARTLAALAARLDARRGGAAGSTTSVSLQRVLKEHPLTRADLGGNFELSPYQLPEWYFHELAPDSPMYNIFVCDLLFRGKLDVNAFLRAFDTIVERHGIFRSHFGWADGKPVQWVRPPRPLDLDQHFVDRTELPEQEFYPEARRLGEEWARYVLDFSEGPVWKFRLIAFRGDRYVLNFLTNHIVWDEGSAIVLGNELRDLYNAYRAGAPSGLAPVEVDYVDYAHWINRAVREGWLESHRRFWLDRFADRPAQMELPIDFARPPHQGFAGADVDGRLSKQTTQRIFDFVRERGDITLSMFLSAVFAMQLGRLTRSRDVVVGVPIANRDHETLERIAGPFATAMPIRWCVDGNMTFEAFLRHTQEIQLDAIEHHAYPSVLAIQEINPEMDASRGRLFSVMFGLQHIKTRFWSELAFDGLELELMPELRGIGPLHSTSRCDLRMLTDLWNDQVEYSLNYNTDLFKPETAERMVRQYLALIDQALADPGRRLGDFELLDDDDRAALARLNATEVAAGGQGTAHGLFEAVVDRTPDACAVRSGDQHVTYAELDARANRWAGALLRAGLGPEDTVGLLFEPSIEMVTAILAVLKAGGAYVALSPEQPMARNQTIVMRSAARFVLVGTGLEATGLDGGAVAIAASALDAEPAARRPPAIRDLARLACVFFTSGSTGEPKGIEIEHRGIHNILCSTRDLYRLGPTDRTLFITPFTFDVSLLDVFGALASGASVVIAPSEAKRDPSAIATLIEREQVAILQCVPIQLASLVEARQRGEISELASLRLVMCGGAAMSRHLRDGFRAAFRSALANHYGPTETTIDVARFDTTQPFDGDMVPIGRPVWNSRLYVLDDALRPVPPGVTGELYVSSAGIARAYLGDPASSARSFIPDPFAATPGSRMYRTGDLAKWSSDVGFVFQGRVDRQVKVRGNRVEVEEIEAELAKHPAVARVAVRHESRSGADHLVAHLELASDARGGDDGLRVFSLAQRPDLRRAFDALHLGSWPAYFEGNAAQREYWPRLLAEHPELQVMIADRDDRLVAGGNAIGISWDGRRESLPAGWDGGIARGFQPGVADCLFVLAGVVDNDEAGRGLSARLIDAFRSLAAARGYLRVLAPVRPTGKAAHPELAFGDWCARTRPDGLPEDPWLRTHVRAGGKVLSVDLRSQRVVGTRAQWEGWTGRRFEATGEVVLADALQAMRFDRELDLGEYWDPCVWVEHTPRTTPVAAVLGVDREAIRAFLRRRLPEYMVPEQVRFLASMPLTSNGKIDLGRLATSAAGEGTAAPWIPLEGEVQLRLGALWRELLGVDEIGATADFFSIGGHSIRAAQLLARIEHAFAVKLTLKVFYANPTIAGLEQALAAEAQPKK